MRHRVSTLATPLPLPSQQALRQLGDFYLRKVADHYLITNDWGYFAHLTPKELHEFVEGRLKRNSPLWEELKNKGFIRGHQNLADLADKFRSLHNYLWQGPSLHIIVLTLRCNLRCVYCHSSVVGLSQTQFDMTQETARATVDLIFKSPNPSLTIEFQGGEPLLNFPVLKFITEYAREKTRNEKRNLKIALVSNFSLMDEQKLDFLLKNEVSLCTSLDGPPEVHDQNRIYLGGNSYESAAQWMSEIRRRGHSAGALMTTTRHSLSYPREIVDEYLRLGQREVFLRPLHYLGFAKRSWKTIGYEDKEFIAFYRKTMDYILEVNRQGRQFRESSSMLLLRKILQHHDSGYVDLRSPCGATLGQVSYNYNGDIYTCDEGRMVGADGDHLFRIGNAHRDSYENLINHSSTKACCAASNMEGQPLCQTCTYKPYCGICPVLNYATQDTIWGRMPTNSYCYIFMHIFDYLFERLAEPENRSILHQWVGMKDTRPPLCVGQLAGG